MPIFRFRCPGCEKEVEKLVRGSDIKSDIICECGDHMERQLPTETSTLVHELKDPARGKHLRKGFEQQLKTRSTAHHDKYELAEKIDRHGTDDAQKFGWFKKIKRL